MVSARFVSQTILNNREMIAETWSHIFFSDDGLAVVDIVLKLPTECLALRSPITTPISLIVPELGFSRSQT